MGKMHEGEVDIDIDLVHRLLLEQFPRWSGLPVEPVHSTGTVNAIYRLVTVMCLRLPRVQEWADDLVKEPRWLPVLAPHLPLAVPAPVARGEPASGYPFPWAIYRWLEGQVYARPGAAGERRAADDLAQFIRRMRDVDPTGAPPSRRDRPLRMRDEETRAAIESLRRSIDADAVSAVWETSLRSQEWDGRRVWTHGDLLEPNLLVYRGRLRAVIDFGNMGAGDPAVDVIPAWTVFGSRGRSVFRSALGVDDATWARGRAFALHQALLIIPYYPVTNPRFAAMATRTVQEVIADQGGVTAPFDLTRIRGCDGALRPDADQGV